MSETNNAVFKGSQVRYWVCGIEDLPNIVNLINSGKGSYLEVSEVQVGDHLCVLRLRGENRELEKSIAKKYGKFVLKTGDDSLYE